VLTGGSQRIVNRSAPPAACDPIFPRIREVTDDDSGAGNLSPPA
jgi:hypothetical protein